MPLPDTEGAETGEKEKWLGAATNAQLLSQAVGTHSTVARLWVAPLAQKILGNWSNFKARPENCWNKKRRDRIMKSNVKFA